MAEQDATIVAPEQYKVEYEDDRVRVVRVSYAPGAKSKLHSHPAVIGVLLTDAHIKFGDSSGQAQEMRITAGQAIPMPAASHTAENLGNQPFEGVLVEIKG